MAKPIIKLGVPATKYTTLIALAERVQASMAGNLFFPIPSPTLLVLAALTTACQSALTAWGTVGHRGSHQDLVNLRSAAFALRNALIQETNYVTNVVPTHGKLY